jgi:hypothetical protein
MGKWMHSCEEASRLTSRSMEEPLRPFERFALGFHLMMCRHCTRFSRQAAFLRRASARVPEVLDRDVDSAT